MFYASADSVCGACLGVCQGARRRGPNGSDLATSTEGSRHPAWSFGHRGKEEIVESEKFDELIRAVSSDASRRGAVRVGLGTLAATALATLGLSAAETEAKKKKKRRKKPAAIVPPPPPPPTPAKTCSGARPVTCGDGCCGAPYAKCCDDLEFTSGKVCAPTSSTCCPASTGGGSCGEGDHTVCCAPNAVTTFGDCAPPDGACCTAEQGGGHCDAPNIVCCPNNCCFPGQACCGAGGSCPTGFVCDGGEGDCCVEEEELQSQGVPRGARASRKHFVARSGIAPV